MLKKPTPDHFDPFYAKYIALIEEDELIAALTASNKNSNELINSLPKEKENFRYAEGKWTVKEVLVHLADVERVFTYRVMRFVRNDPTALPGFDENAYVDNIDVSNRTFFDILEELNAVRAASIAFFKSLKEEDLYRSGIANGKELNVGTMAFACAGHELHHLKIIKERYL